jgi:hypothetical protein
MTTHARGAIRSAVVAALTGLTTTGAAVYATRIYPIDETALPCLLVSTDGETIDQVDTVQIRDLTLTVKACVMAAATMDASLDSILAEVETAMSSLVFGNGKKAIFQSISISYADTLAQPIGVATLTYSLPYYTAAGAPGSAL